MVILIYSHLGLLSCEPPWWIFTLVLILLTLWSYHAGDIYYRIISLNKPNVMTFEITWNNQVGMENFRGFFTLFTTSFYEYMWVLPSVGRALYQKYVNSRVKSSYSNRFLFLFSILYSILYSHMNIILLLLREHLRHLCLRRLWSLLQLTLYPQFIQNFTHMYHYF